MVNSNQRRRVTDIISSSVSETVFNSVKATDIIEDSNIIENSDIESKKNEIKWKETKSKDSKSNESKSKESIKSIESKLIEPKLKDSKESISIEPKLIEYKSIEPKPKESKPNEPKQNELKPDSIVAINSITNTVNTINPVAEDAYISNPITTGLKTTKVITTLNRIESGKITAQSVSKVFIQPDGEQTIALSDVNIEINPGEFVSLIGPSGCGKSTLLRLIAGLSTPTSGDIRLDQDIITKPGYERGLVFQDPTLFPWLTVYDNVAYGLKTRRIYKQNKKQVEEFLDLVGLKDFAKSYPHQLSGGMAQRASLARALVNHPKVLLLDEPLGALDAFTRMNMQDEILRIWKERGTTMIMVTHDVDEAIYLSDRIFVMTPRPAKIESIIDIEISRGENLGRQRDSDLFLGMRSKILKILNFAGKSQTLEYYL